MRLALLSAACGIVFAAQGVSPARAQSICPDNFTAFADATAPLICTCSDEATTRGSVWGSDIYTADSSVCRAALHAGIVGVRGGRVAIHAEPGRRSYAGVTRNGVTSSNYGSWGASFRFAPGPGWSWSGPGQGGDGAAGSICPDNFTAYADTTEPLSCTCSDEATTRGSVWGMDIYTADSSVCRAALHAGIVGVRGGRVTVKPEPGRRAYPGVTRNGVTSSNYGPWGSSFTFLSSSPPDTNSAGASQKSTGSEH